MVLTKGRFITLEGGEGVGKTTLAAALLRRLSARSIDVKLTREPGGTAGADALRALVLRSPETSLNWSPLTEALLFYAARTDHLDKLIRPHVAKGGWVICDRFSDSTRAYQAAAGGVVSEAIETLERMCVGASAPDLTLVLDLPLDASRERMGVRGKANDTIEARGSDYHARVRQAFLDIAKREPKRCAVLDAAQTPDALADQAMALIDARLGAA
jgi:dTMP kinase